MSVGAHVHLMDTPTITTSVHGDKVLVMFTTGMAFAILSDTPEALVATLTEALEAVDRAWRASRGEVTP